MRNLILTSLLFIAVSLPAFAENKLMVMDGWVRATSTGNTAGYVMLHNISDAPVTITSFSSAKAAQVMAHETVTENGVAKMRPLKSLTIQPEEMATFAPGANHLMIMGLAAPLATGAALPITVHFADGSTQDIELDVKSGQ